MNKSTVFAIAAFSFMSFFLYQGLYNDPKKVESPLIGKEFPKFKLNDLFLNTAHDNDSFQVKKRSLMYGQVGVLSAKENIHI
jgi:hypothetical protein